MEYIIIGVHGLYNKPEPEILSDGWQKAIIEGLTKNEKLSIENINFKMMYWADIMYPEYDTNAELYKEATDGALKEYKDGWIDNARATIQGHSDTLLDFAKSLFNIDFVGDEVLERKAKDLYKYYFDEEKRNKIRNRFIELFKEHQDKKIIIASHSMGTIVAYDSLVKLHQEDPLINIEHFITMGSPLGLPHVKYRIYEEFKKTTTPDNTLKWSNFSDKRDKISIDTHLKDDYTPNENDVKVKDDLVFNDWEGNPHKSYGYLRTPEFSKAINLTLKGHI
ncbi:lipase/acyltransferase domain-containing protein [Campylobacterota bacterium DY0563]